MSGEDRASADPAQKRRRLVFAGMGVFILIAAVVGYFLSRREPPPLPPSTAPLEAAVEGLPEVGAPKAIEVPETPALPSIVIDVLEPKRVVGALLDNAWLSRQAEAPLGRGFLGAWGAFFGSRGEQLKAPFSGTLASYFSTTFLAAPFRLVYFSGPDTPGAPVFVQEDPPVAVTAAFDVLEATVRRGQLTASRCPGDPEPAEKTNVEGAEGQVTDAGTAAPVLFEISRWLVADQVLFAARHASRLVLARDARAVLLGVCVERTRLANRATPGADVELSFRVAGLGREAQVLVGALGLGDAPGLAFRVDAGRLVAHGISGAVRVPGRLSSAPFSEALLGAIPAETPVVFGLVPVLPETLSLAALSAHFGEGPPPEGGLARQVVFVFTPHGAAGQPTEIGFLWSRLEDEPALAEIFNGPNALHRRVVCGQLAFASETRLLDRIQETCQKKRPSLLASAPAVVSGLKTTTSLALSVQLGRLLSGLVEDAYREDSNRGDSKPKIGSAPPLPAELEAARRELEALPFLGFLGRVEGDALVPGGFGS